jgi:hypothetical protein
VYTSHWTSEEILRNVHDFGDFPKMNISINHISKKIKITGEKPTSFFVYTGYDEISGAILLVLRAILQKPPLFFQVQQRRS